MLFAKCQRNNCCAYLLMCSAVVPLGMFTGANRKLHNRFFLLIIALTAALLEVKRHMLVWAEEEHLPAAALNCAAVAKVS